LFCDGHELCDDGLCVTSVLPCPENESCDEEFDACFGGEGEGEGEVSEGEGEPDRAGASDEALFVSGSGLFSCSNSPSSGIGFLALLFPILLVFGKRSKTIAMSVMLMAATAVNAEGLNRITGPVSSVDTPQAASADTLPELTLQTSAGLDYSHAPVVLRDSDFAKRVNLVEHQFSGRINAAFGLADFVQLDLSLPASLAFGPGFDLGDVPAVGLQDMMGGVRVRLTERDSPVRAAFSLRGSLPTSLVSSNGFPLLGESLPTVSPGVLLSTGGEAASVMLDTSYTLRAPKAVADLQIGHTVNASLGGQVRLIDDHLWAIADVGGSFSVNHLFSNRLFLPLEATVGLRGRNGPIFGTASVGSGLMPDVGTPDVRALATVGFDFDFAPKKVTPAVTPVAEPAPPPPAPLDSDGDGILDGSDACPEDPEDFDGFEDADGCPETEKVVVGPDSIVILEPIYFFFDSDRIRPESFDVLEDVVTALKEHPEIRLLSVEGHTSSEGSTSYNQRLSAKRAAAVVAFLAKAGVAAERLSSLGHGESKPVAPNTTRAGRERNRRVEFLILEKQ
jgi:outer membrane protein OmpA-like peptidoglycan-associated protein